ncbi:MAG: hypothetical protein WD402_03835 [Chloroflexota bacterium]
MNVDEMLSGARDTMTVKRVYGDPIERDGVLVIPAAKGPVVVAAATTRTTPAAGSASAPSRPAPGSSAMARSSGSRRSM